MNFSKGEPISPGQQVHFSLEIQLYDSTLKPLPKKYFINTTLVQSNEDNAPARKTKSKPILLTPQTRPLLAPRPGIPIN